jgi:hypothetical protein
MTDPQPPKLSSIDRDNYHRRVDALPYMDDALDRPGVVALLEIARESMAGQASLSRVSEHDREEGARFRGLQVYGLYKRTEIGDPFSAVETLVSAETPEAGQDAAKRIWGMHEQYVESTKQFLDATRDIGR